MAKLQSEAKAIVVETEPKVETEPVKEETEPKTEPETVEGEAKTVDLQQLEANYKAEELKVTALEESLKSGTLSVDEIIKTSTEILKLRESTAKLSTIYNQAKLESIKSQLEAEILPILAKYEIKRILVENFSYVDKNANPEITVTINRFKLNTDVEAFVPTWSKKNKAAAAKASKQADNTGNADFTYGGNSRVEYKNTLTNETVKASAIFNQQSLEFRQSQFGTATNGSWNRVLESAHKLNLLTEYVLVTK